MTISGRGTWPLYTLLGAGAALALGWACARQRRGRRLRSGQVRELRDLWLTVGGQHMYARVAAEPARSGGVPVVLVHGLGVSGSYFLPLAQQLAADVDVYVPDLPGHGLSQTPGVQPDVAGLAQALVDWMDAAGLARAALLGHSMGCQVAVEAALCHPGRIDRLILIAPVPDPAARTAWRQTGRLVMGSVFERPSLIPHVLRDYLRIGSRFLPEFRHMLAYPIETALPKIGVPVLLLRGEHDFVAPQAWLDEAAALLRAPPTVVVPYWGHAVQYSGANRVAAAVRSFLAAGSADIESLAFRRSLRLDATVRRI